MIKTLLAILWVTVLTAALGALLGVFAGAFAGAGWLVFHWLT
jgi:hypothetical protein